MVLYQKGSHEAFEVLYQRYSPRVFGYLLKRVSNRDRAQEIFQMVFLRLHKSRHQYNPQFLFAPWLFTLCRTTLIDAVRTAKLFDSGKFESLKNEVPTPTNSDDKLDISEHTTEEQRALLTMRYDQDMSFDAIAKQLETSPIAIRQRFSRMIRQLRKRLSKTS